LPELKEHLRIRPAVPGDIDVLTMLLELLFAIEAVYKKLGWKTTSLIALRKYLRREENGSVWN
jgi:hypothetical protein